MMNRVTEYWSYNWAYCCQHPYNVLIKQLEFIEKNILPEYNF